MKSSKLGGGGHKFLTLLNELFQSTQFSLTEVARVDGKIIDLRDVIYGGSLFPEHLINF